MHKGICVLKFISALIVSSCFSTAFASDTTSSWHTPAETRELLGTLALHAENTPALNGKFIQQKQLNGLPLPLLASGVYQYQPSNGLSWTTQKPVESTLLITEQGIESHQQNNSNRFVANIFLSVIRGDLQQLNDYFHIQSKGGSSGWQLHLTPSQDALKNYLSTIDITGSDATETLTIAEKNGDSTHIKLFESNPHKALTSSKSNFSE